MDATSELKLINYRVEKTYFEINKDFNFESLQSVTINPHFNRVITKINQNEYVIMLSVEITKDKHEAVIPFYAEAKMSSIFYFNDWESVSKKDIALSNATAILFPYLRALLSTITTNGSVPPYVLPVMNINRLFCDK